MGFVEKVWRAVFRPQKLAGFVLWLNGGQKGETWGKKIQI